MVNLEGKMVSYLRTSVNGLINVSWSGYWHWKIQLRQGAMCMTLVMQVSAAANIQSTMFTLLKGYHKATTKTCFLQIPLLTGHKFWLQNAIKNQWWNIFAHYTNWLDEMYSIWNR